jgi:hypothetical protein
MLENSLTEPENPIPGLFNWGGTVSYQNGPSTQTTIVDKLSVHVVLKGGIPVPPA